MKIKALDVTSIYFVLAMFTFVGHTQHDGLLSVQINSSNKRCSLTASVGNRKKIGVLDRKSSKKFPA